MESDLEKALLLEEHNIRTIRFEAEVINSQAPVDVLQPRDYQILQRDISELFQNLSRLLNDKQEKDFIQYFRQYNLDTRLLNNNEQTNNVKLLVIAIQHGLNNAVEVILNSGIDNIKLDECNAIEIACVVGNRKALQMLLKQDNLYLNPDLLVTATMYLNGTTEGKEKDEIYDYMGCFDILLDSHKFDVNKVNDLNMSALYYAIKHTNKKAIMKLLGKGAYIGATDGFNKISNINSKVLEDCFDKCITTNGLNHGDDNFEIEMNYTNLLANNSNQSEAMLQLKFIADSDELNHLLDHPLIACYLHLMRHRLNFITFYIWLSSWLCWHIFITYIVYNISDKVLDNESQTIEMDCPIWGIIYYIFREGIKCITMGREIFTISRGVLANSAALIIFAILTFLHSNYEEEPQRTFAVVTILLISVDIYMTSNSFSSERFMLMEFCGSFFKSLYHCFIFFISFSICFHMVFKKHRNRNDRRCSENDNGYFNHSDGFGNDNGYFNITLEYGNDSCSSGNYDGYLNSNTTNSYFDTLLGSLFKTLIMVTGEFNSESLNLSSPTSYGVFLLYVGFMSIVLLNLLNSLAASDAEVINRKRRIAFFNDVWVLKSIFKILQPGFELLPSSFRDNYGKYVFIQPNNGHKILISKPAYIKNKNQSFCYRRQKSIDQCRTSIFSFYSFVNRKAAPIKIKIVQDALAVIAKQNRIKNEERIILQRETRLKNIEKDVKELLSLLKNSLQSVIP